MTTGERFLRAVELLPDAVRERLDGHAPLDWTALEDPGIGPAVDEAVVAHRGLPKPMESLVHRLTRDVGMVPADIAAGAERQGAASAWIPWVTVEADGDGYLIRNDRSGEIHTGVRPESIAGYATLAVVLAAAVHRTCEQWVEAGGRHEAAAEDQRSNLARCAIRMRGQLLAQPEAIAGSPTTAILARTLEYAWNAQPSEVREALAGARLSAAGGVHPPRRNHYTPAGSHRLHAFDPGEIRWLQTLAERSGRSASELVGMNRSGETTATGSGINPDGDATATATAGATAGAGGGAAAPPAAGQMELGTDPTRLTPGNEVAELERATNHLPGAVRMRLGEVGGAEITQALERLQSRFEVDRIRAALESGNGSQVTPKWLEKLANALLMDTGAETREGFRTGRIRIESGPALDGGVQGTEVETGKSARLTPAGLVEQVRLSLAFAQGAWSGLTALQTAAREAHWILNEDGMGTDDEFETTERETLEAAVEIGQALERLQHAPPDAGRKGPPSALEQAEMAAEALRRVGPTTLTAAGWPGATAAPDARKSKDVARIADVGEALHGEIRTIANRLIARWIAEAHPFGEARKG